jgi:hypothetical protein
VRRLRILKADQLAKITKSINGKVCI